MDRLRVVTWNVLHRVHGENWAEPQLGAFPDERERSAGVTRRVTEWLDDGVDAVCLQEASGDLSNALEAALGPRARRFAHVYPRVPKPRTAARATLGDPRELLLTLTTSSLARLVETATFESDPGKGLLAVELAGAVVVVNTHVSFGPRRDAQLAKVRERARSRNAAVVVGDFNAPADVVATALGGDFAISDLRGELPTRAPSRSHAGKIIDHVAVVGAAIVSARVIDVAGLSDHNAVFAEVEIGS